jgi:hypothetical protein
MKEKIIEGNEKKPPDICPPNIVLKMIIEVLMD